MIWQDITVGCLCPLWHPELVCRTAHVLYMVYIFQIDILLGKSQAMNVTIRFVEAVDSAFVFTVQKQECKLLNYIWILEVAIDQLNQTERRGTHSLFFFFHFCPICQPPEINCGRELILRELTPRWTRCCSAFCVGEKFVFCTFFFPLSSHSATSILTNPRPSVVLKYLAMICCWIPLPGSVTECRMEKKSTVMWHQFGSSLSQTPQMVLPWSRTCCQRGKSPGEPYRASSPVDREHH